MKGQRDIRHVNRYNHLCTLPFCRLLLSLDKPLFQSPPAPLNPLPQTCSEIMLCSVVFRPLLLYQHTWPEAENASECELAITQQCGRAQSNVREAAVCPEANDPNIEAIPGTLEEDNATRSGSSAGKPQAKRRCA